MAVITELIQAGLRLKQGGNLGGAIEHFKQLHATYPDHARIMFELAACWRAFGVPEQALPIYRNLLALPKSQGLPPKDMPRLYTQLGATLLELEENAESLAIFDEGLRLHPSYRALRAWRIFALTKAGSHQSALQDALELMLESLAPSRWDIFEAEIKARVKTMRDELPEAGEYHLAASAELAAPSSAEQTDAVAESATMDQRGNEPVAQLNKINITSEAPAAAETDVAVNLVKPTKSKRSRRRKNPRPQMGKKAVRIDIVSDADENPKNSGEDDAAGGALKIPIDPD